MNSRARQATNYRGWRFWLPSSVSALLAEEEARAARNAVLVKDIYEALTNVVRKSDNNEGEINYLQSFTDRFVTEFLLSGNKPRIANPVTAIPAPHPLPAKPPAVTPPRSPQPPRKAPTSSAPPASAPTPKVSFASVAAKATHLPTTILKAPTKRNAPSSASKSPKRLDSDGRADKSAIKTTLAEMRPELGSDIKAITRRQDGFTIIFGTPEALSLALQLDDQLKANNSGDLTAHIPRVGYVFKRIPRKVTVLSAGLVDTSLEDISATAKEKTGHQPSLVQRSKHDSDSSPFRTAVVFFDRAVASFDLWGSARSQPYRPHPKVVQCTAC
ncbi:hypothetical protein SEPCBS57363_001847 [Sporothrix epigloea]|uniref:Uncharacterized protein n=1 Tax=Sporothrix epigloea TaxID=1892477 RepID=A0ABP0DE83_9PEZI